MDLHDRELDSLITLTLQPQTVTSRQKQRAWEQLQTKLAAEATLPTVQPSFGDQAMRLFRSIGQSLRSLMLEEAPYQNARQERYAFRYYSFSSRPVSFAMELIGPLRITSMGQVC